MKHEAPQSATPLSRLIALRQQDVERRSAELAAKQQLRERYQRNLAQLEALGRAGTLTANAPASAATGALPARPAAALAGLALNSAQYKQSLLQMAGRHREDLALHEADLAVTQRALAEVAREREALQQLLQQQQRREQRQQAQREQKRQDDLAAQVWLRRGLA